MSAVFRVRDQNGNIVEIPVLRGEQGPQGPQGPQGKPGEKGETGAFNANTAYAFSKPISFNGGTTTDASYSLFSKYRVQIGDNTSNTYTGVITWRNCGTSAGGVNGAGFYVNSNGTAKFVHKSGYNGSGDDAVLSFNSGGLYFATAPGGNVGAKLGSKVLTAAGGEITGKLTLDEGMTLKKGFELDGDVSTYAFGYNWDDGTGPGFAMRGSSFSGSGDGPGCFVFWARKDKTGQVKLIGSPSGTLSWNGLNVETLFAQTKGTSSPSAWKQHTASGLIQQGGYLAIADVGEKITFPTAYKHTPTVVINYIDPENPAPSWLKSVDAKGFTPATSSTTATGLVWFAVGFG